MKHGCHTGRLGEWLSQKFRDTPYLQYYQLYYDHGVSSSPNVAAIKGFFGERVSNKNRLADIDLLIASHDGEAILLVEIEERISEPKKILGDVFALLMCNRISIGKGKQQYFSISSDTQLLIAGVVKDKGQKLAKIEQIIEPRLRQFTTPSGGIPIQNVNFLFKPDNPTMVAALREHILDFLAQSNKSA